MTRAVAAVLVAITCGCTTPSRGPAPPKTLAEAAAVPGFHAIRSFGDQLDDAFREEIFATAELEFSGRAASAPADALPPAHYLAISGGGANGAYGAGLLCGWTQTGTRPEFKVVTGVSTGALTAPFAFLGPEYDATLEHFYTTIRTRDILRERSPVAGLLGDAMADVDPLKHLLRRVIDDRVVARIAEERARGRILLVGTTNLDAQRTVVWNLTAIAASGHPRAGDLIRTILLTSASIPVAFPPILIDVEVDGRRYQEMHVDGGALSQVFFYPPTLRLGESKIERERRLYVIRNSRLAPQPAEVERSTLAIAARAVDSMILSQGVGDLYRLYGTSLRDGVDFQMTAIPDTFDAVPREAFDSVYMKALFDVGRAAALTGTAWSRHPPGFGPAETRRS